MLTNGVNYRFYSDLETPNVMDKEPFFEFSMENLTPQVAAVLSNFEKGHFNPEEIRKMAVNLKYAKGIREMLTPDWAPSDDLVKALAVSTRYTGTKVS